MEESRYEIIVTNQLPSYDPWNKRIKSNEIKMERKEARLENPDQTKDRFALSTRVAPTNCEMTYWLVLDIDPKQIENARIGRIWASQEVLEKERNRGFYFP